MSVLVPMIFGLAAAVFLYGRFAPAGVGVPDLRPVHGGGDVHHGVPDHGPHPEGAEHDALGDRTAVAHLGRDGRRARLDHAGTRGRARRLPRGLGPLRHDDPSASSRWRSPCSSSGGRCWRARIAHFARDGRPEGPLLAMLLIGTFACAYASKGARRPPGVRSVPVRGCIAARRSPARGADRARRVRRDHRADAGVLRAGRPQHDGFRLRGRRARCVARSCWSRPWRARCSAAPRAPASRATRGARASPWARS